MSSCSYGMVKIKGHLGADLTTSHARCAVRQKIAQVLNIFLNAKMMAWLSRGLLSFYNEAKINDTNNPGPLIRLNFKAVLDGLLFFR